MYDNLVRELQCCPDGEEGCSRCEYRTSLHCRETLMRQAADAIEELQAQIDGWIEQERKALLKSVPKWIPVKERLPKDGEFVLVCNDDGHMMIAKHETETYEWYYKYTNYDFDIWDNGEQGPVCYWMPLPEPPKEETE